VTEEGQGMQEQLDIALSSLGGEGWWSGAHRGAPEHGANAGSFLIWYLLQHQGWRWEGL